MTHASAVAHKQWEDLCAKLKEMDNVRRIMTGVPDEIKPYAVMPSGFRAEQSVWCEVPDRKTAIRFATEVLTPEPLVAYDDGQRPLVVPIDTVAPGTIRRCGTWLTGIAPYYLTVSEAGYPTPWSITTWALISPPYNPQKLRHRVQFIFNIAKDEIELTNGKLKNEPAHKWQIINGRSCKFLFDRTETVKA
jgi:hypothetical protein